MFARLCVSDERKVIQSNTVKTFSLAVVSLNGSAEVHMIFVRPVLSCLCEPNSDYHFLCDNSKPCPTLYHTKQQLTQYHHSRNIKHIKDGGKLNCLSYARREG